MSASDNTAEGRIRDCVRRGDYRAAATEAVESYGPELLGFLTDMLSSESDAREVFSSFCEDLWRGLPGFEWRASARSWCYTLARNAALRFVRAPERRRGVPLSRADEPPAVSAADRTSTAVYRRTETKSRIQVLRRRLPEEEQTLLILRVDRGLSWREVAAVLAEDGGGDADLERLAARARKRFQLAKDRLRAMARDEGLL